MQKVGTVLLTSAQAGKFGTVQLTPAQPEMLYSRSSGRCVCGDTVKLRADGFWIHGNNRTYCRRNL